MSDLQVMIEGDPPEKDIFHYHRRLVRWTTKENTGYLHPDIQIAHSSAKGFHMVVAQGREIKNLTRITSSPMACTLSVLNALDVAPFSSHGSKFPKSFLRSYALKPQLLQAFFLMEQYLRGEESWWAPYIQTLPTPADLEALMFNDPDDRAWLEGTNLKSAFVDQASKWQEMYTKGLRDLRILNCQNALNGKYSWELFRWAASIFGSRSFTSEVLCDTEPSEQARLEGRNGVKESEYDFLKPLFVERFAVLLPLLDILNHRPAAQVEWQARSSFIGMQILSSYTSGEELCNNYGPRDNEGLLLSYGFTIPQNTFDHVAIALRPPPPGSPLATARKHWKADQRSAPNHECYIFSRCHPRAKPDMVSCFESALFSYDLLDALSLLKGNDRELQTMYHYKQSLMSYSLAKPHNFDNFRNLLAVLAQLHLDCTARAKRLRATYPEGTPCNSKQRYAKIYRDSQAEIVEIAGAVCAHVLTRASSDCSEEKLLRASFVDVSVGTRGKDHDQGWSLSTLLGEHPIITRQDELLTVGRMLDFLPESKANTYRRVQAVIKQHLPGPRSPRREDEPTNATTSPSKRKRSPNQPQPEVKQSKSTSPTAAPDTKTALPPASPPSLQTPLPTSPLDPQKTQFTLVLSLCLHLFLTGVPLSARLTKWLKQLTSWYPPDDGNWNYVPHDGPYAPDEEPPAGLMALLKASKAVLDTVEGQGDSHGAGTEETELFLGLDDRVNEILAEASGLSALDGTVAKWLKPERLCWAWNVMEEEGVVVSKEIVQMSESLMSDAGNDTATASRDEIEGEVDFLLYCGQ